MRIISEDRAKDIPYEQSVLLIQDEKIVAVTVGDVMGFFEELAHPDTLRQARAAMDMIVESYVKGAKVVYMDYVMEEVRNE